jgi:cation transport ATPase
MQQQLKKQTALFFCGLGIACGNVVTAVLSVFAPEFLMDQSLALSAVLEVLVVALPGAIFLSRSSGRVFCARFIRAPLATASLR